MRVETAGGVLELGVVETAPTIGIIDFSRRVTDDFGVTTVVKRGFARRMSVRLKVAFDEVDAIQRALAALRATPALWIADDRFESLSVEGFYKDFSIDLNVPPVSFCTLTVEGLAETGSFDDPGTDPAPDARPSTMRLLQPVDVMPSMLIATNVPETDYPEWSAGTPYALGARVIKAATHRIYESAVAGNIGHDPVALSGQWIDLAPTNRWAMFDQALGTATERAGSVAFTLYGLGDINALALLDVTASSVRVQADGYDRTAVPTSSPGMVTYLDIPTAGGPVIITATGSGIVSIGTLLIGNLVGLGITEASPTATIADFSRKDTDEFGEVSVVERAWAKRMGVRALIDTDALDVVVGRIATVRAVPSLWIADEGLEAVTIYGFFKDFSVEVSEGVSLLSLSIEGLSKAAKIAGLPTAGEVDAIKDKLDGIEPGATNGAPTGSPIGDSTAQDVIAALKAMAATADPASIVAGAHAFVDRLRDTALGTFEAQLLSEERKARIDRLLHLGGVELATRVKQEITERIEGEVAIVHKIEEIEATATNGISAAMAAIESEAEVRASAIAAETYQRELAFSIFYPEVDSQFNAMMAAIMSEAATRASAVSAETSQRTLAISNLQSAITGGLMDVTAAISSEATTRAAADIAETTDRNLALSEIETNIAGEIVTVMAAIASEATTRATHDEAEAALREVLAASIESDLADISAAVDSETSARVTADLAEASAREDLAATLSSDIADVSSAVTSEATARASADAAETEQREVAISELETLIGDEIATVSAAIVAEATTRASAIEAEAETRGGLIASLESDIADVNAGVLEEASARATADTAEANARLALAATLSGDIADVTALVATEEAARVSEDEALAAMVTTIETTVDGHTAEIETFAESIDGLLARWSVKLTSGNKIIGIEANNGSGVGGFDFIADYVRFWDADETTGIAPFAFEDGIVRMTEVEVEKIRIGSRYSNSGAQIVANGTAIYGEGDTSANFITILSDTIILDGPGTVMVSGSFAQGTTAGDHNWGYATFINGVGAFNGGGARVQEIVPISGAVYLAAGTYTVEIKWFSHSSVFVGAKFLCTSAIYS